MLYAICLFEWPINGLPHNTCLSWVNDRDRRLVVGTPSSSRSVGVRTPTTCVLYDRARHLNLYETSVLLCYDSALNYFSNHNDTGPNFVRIMQGWGEG